MNASPKILIADDEPNIVLSLEFLLQQHGYQTAAARNGGETLQLITVFAPDLILLDIMMPLYDGFEICKRIRENPATRHIKIILLTARGRNAEIEKGLALGADVYVTKPFSTSALLAEIQKLMAR